METLLQIWKKVKQERFRVRNVKTLEDILIFKIVNWTKNQPITMSGLTLDNKFTIIHYPTNKKVFALLSTKEECNYWISMDDLKMRLKAKSFYSGLT